MTRSRCLDAPALKFRILKNHRAEARSRDSRPFSANPPKFLAKDPTPEGVGGPSGAMYIYRGGIVIIEG
jgi:hypothetical protein